MIGSLVRWAARHAALTAFVALLVGLGAVAVARARLGVTTDTNGMFAASLPWKQRQAVLQHAFPENENLLVAVITARLPEEADETAEALAAALRRDGSRFLSVREPDSGAFFRRNAFLFLGTDPLRDLLNRTIDAEPFLGALAADPSLVGIAASLGLLAEGATHGAVDLAHHAPALEAFGDAFADAAAGHPTRLSWERLLAGPLASEAGQFRFVLAKPVLDYGALAPGARGTAAIRAAARSLPFVRDGAARVRITGSVALDDAQFASVAQGALWGLAASVTLVMLWLFLAVRTWRLVAPILLVLALGLVLTTAFAALAIGTLNLISIAFAILFVGIAVDFAIQFAVRFRDARAGDGIAVLPSVAATGRRCGGQILLAATATACGFLAFTPTAFAGVAELGLIAGAGMLIAFACTVTVLPALIVLFRPREGAREIGFGRLRPLDRLLAERRRPVLALFGVLAALGVLSLPLLRFDGNPLDTQNPNTEAMKTVSALSRDPRTNPDTAELLLPTLADADRVASRLRALPLVSDVVTLSSFVPDHQAAKLAMIGEAASILQPVLDVAPTPTPDAAAIRAALVTLAARLAKAAPQAPILRPLARASDALARVPDAQLVAANRDMTVFLPLELDRLRAALAARPVRLADVPATVRRDWIAPDGRAHLEAEPSAAVHSPATLRRFVDEIRRVEPDVSGAAVTIVDSASTIIAAFRTAAIGAVLAIAFILALFLRRVLDVALVVAPLLLSGMLTALCCVVFGIEFNFANIIAMPLLLGVGTSFNIYFVMNWRAGERRPLPSAAARAIVFSALTTGSAFGTLAMSGDPGTASLGRILLLSLACTLVATLLFVPALLAACGAATAPAANGDAGRG